MNIVYGGFTMQPCGIGEKPHFTWIPNPLLMMSADEQFKTAEDELERLNRSAVVTQMVGAAR